MELMEIIDGSWNLIVKKRVWLTIISDAIQISVMTLLFGWYPKDVYVNIITKIIK